MASIPPLQEFGNSLPPNEFHLTFELKIFFEKILNKVTKT